MPTRLYWLDEVWPGRVALSARPRGGDWLSDEITDWKSAGVSTVLSLLEAHEERDLDLRAEGAEVRAEGLEFLSLPIPDRQIPKSVDEGKLADTIEKLSRTLSAGKNVLVHCRQGVGRSGLVAACLLVRRGLTPGAAVEMVSSARGVSIPETNEQRDWIDHYAARIYEMKR
jgi:protein-tyrosine phosphatase